ncbi:divergent polysaccharide deacetylase family protein [Yoonia maritima]|uniref:divergent polysaccharide deacetylase family protein n=1 Tax=Yoonia maritima TaxID=1435347 RepID=UPI0013A6849C|nr:divergent polysaccharide deacetylase family protein [Yoonia maritima]
MPLVAAPQAAQGSDINLDTGATPPEVDREFAVTAPRVSAPEAEVAEPTTDTEPAAPPQTLQLETELSVPADVGEATIVTALEEPVLAPTLVDPPQMPIVDESAVIATQPVQPASEPSELDAPTVAGIAEDALVPPPPKVIVDPGEQVRVDEDVSLFVAPTPEAVVEPLPEAIVTPVPELATVPEVTELPEITVLPVPDETPSAEAELTPPVQAPVIVEPEPDAESVVDAPEEATGVTTPVNRVKVNRPGAEPAETPEPEIEISVEEGEATVLPALERYATAFENPNGLPLISILLVDDGSNGVMAAEVAALPLPVTVVLHALDPNAAENMRAYRAAGVETAMQTSLPEGAVPTDVEVAFEAAFGILPETAILFADGTGVLQNNRAVTEQVMRVLAADGRGLVTVQRGLGSAQRAAEQAGIPTATVLRDIDNGVDDPSIIERSLDQSALRARQTGNAVLLGHAQTNTISALTNWALSVDQDQMLLAPVSAVLLGIN